jgi:hypothetical protein
MVHRAPGADHVLVSATTYRGEAMSSTQIIIVAVLSLAVVALLMVRQRQVD